MTQPFISDTSLPSTQLSAELDKLAQNKVDFSQGASSEQPAIIHPNFDPKQTPLDPARPLSDIPEPARSNNDQLRRLYGKSARFAQPKAQSLSKWQLIASKPFAEHLALLSAAQLIELPESFYRRCPKQEQNASSSQSLLSSIEKMTLLDLADIQNAIHQYPKLNRYGFMATTNNFINTDANSANKQDTEKSLNQALSLRVLTKRYNPDELLNSLYADDWQVILQPQDFETGEGSLATDILACSVAVHALQQCPTRKTINQSYSAEQICHYVRSYLLSQLYHSPASRYHYRQIRLFAGHIIVAAHYLGWEIQISAEGHAYFNISSRCGLLTRYANMDDYLINGWSS
ncbi:hypothetical protein M0N77_01170 [Psychrobacter sp. AH5]|uniref:hypothetical protein n=1 Tax=Psychrobacter sp. AH5 TaxID=2937433 RepID=UPI00333F5987